MPIKTAILFFPVLAFIITLPYMFIQYRKYGSINKLRTLIIYSFVLYLTVAYFLIILPLPSFDKVINLTTPKFQLEPFNFIQDIMNKSSIVLTEPNTYINLFKEGCTYQVLYNLVLLLPLGIYLRYYFKCKLIKTILITFLVSLFFEVTQLSGLYFIYPRSYRLFDVDDLIINTLGGIIGYVLCPIFTFFLPTREEIDEKSYVQGIKVSFFRRLFAFLIDQFIIIILISVLPLPTYKHLLVYFIYYMIIPIITKGITLGKKLLRIRITDLDGNDCKWYQYTFRYIIQYVEIFLIPILMFNLFIHVYQANEFVLVVVFMIVILIYSIYLFVKFYKYVFNEELFLYEKISETINTSMIEVVVDEEIELENDLDIEDTENNEI